MNFIDRTANVVTTIAAVMMGVNEAFSFNPLAEVLGLAPGEQSIAVLAAGVAGVYSLAVKVSDLANK